ncbi:MAG: hypothetical protein WD771_05975 [Gemmatimonadaceae bacterium]
MHKGWKIAIVLIGVVVLYLGIRDYRTAKWLRQELFTDWIEYNRFQYDPNPGPPDTTKPPPPPPDFGF